MRNMAEDCVGNSIATTSTTSLNRWYLHAANSVSSWNNSRANNTWNNQVNPNSSSSCEEDISVSTSSFTNVSNHSSLTVESSRRLVDPPAPSSNELMGEHGSDNNHLWSHVLSGVGSNGELHNGQEIGENFLEALPSKNMTSSMFEPACDYLKKLDHTSWEYYGGSTSFNAFENKHLNDDNNNNYNNNGFNEAMNNENNERLTKLSNLVSTWSIAPPDPEVSSHHHHHHGHHFDHHHHPPTNMSLGSSMEHHDQFPQSFGDSTSSCPIGGGGSTNSNSEVLFPSCYDHHQDMKVKQEFQQASDVQGAILGKPFISTTSGYHQNNGLLVNNNSISSVGESGKFYHDLPNLPSSCTRNISDVIAFNSRLARPIIGIHAQKPNLKHLNLSESKKQGLHHTPSPNGQIRTNNGRGEGTTAREVKKKRSEESSESILKKPKQGTSTTSSTKVQAPKMKLGNKITALQQIVSPFGKTDTASVLFEAIGYIKFLQEQVQLLSNPYLKSNSHKDPWGSLDRKDNEDGKLELRSKGLCLVPTSCTPLVYRDNSGPDYWTPAYRGCLYR